MPRRATYKCPECDSRNIVPIIYGMPGMDLREEEMEALRLIGNYGMLLTVALLTGCSGYDGSIAGDPVAQPPVADAPIDRADPDAKAAYDKAYHLGP